MRKWLVICKWDYVCNNEKYEHNSFFYSLVEFLYLGVGHGAIYLIVYLFGGKIFIFYLSMYLENHAFFVGTLSGFYKLNCSTFRCVKVVVSLLSLDLCYNIVTSQLTCCTGGWGDWWYSAVRGMECGGEVWERLTWLGKVSYDMGGRVVI